MASLRLLPRSIPRLRTLLTSRSLSTPSVSSLLSKACQTNPLKYAAKFISTPNSTLWTNHELNSHVNALSSGLSETGVTSSTIVSLLHPASAEYSILLFAASNINATVIPFPVSDSPAVDVTELAAFIEKHQPDALFLGKEYVPSDCEGEDGIFRGLQTLLNSLDAHASSSDAAGSDGFSPLTGRPFASDKYPSVKLVVHTSDCNLRSCVTFKSLLVYNGQAVKTDGSAPVLVTEEGQLTEGQVLKRASQLGDSLKLSGQHDQRQGKLVVSPGVQNDSFVATVAAVMKGSLWINPGDRSAKEVGETEEALVV